MPDTVRTQPVARSVYSQGCIRAIQVSTFSSRQPREKADSTLKYSPMSRTDNPLANPRRQHPAAQIFRGENKNVLVTRTGFASPSALCTRSGSQTIQIPAGPRVVTATMYGIENSTTR